MSLRGFLRTLIVNETFPTDSSTFSSMMQNSILQNDTLLNTTSAIPDLSATADTFGDIGFIKNIPVGIEVCLPVILIYMYIHCYIGSPREMWRQWKQRQMTADSIVLLDDQSSIASRNSNQTIDCSSIVYPSNLSIQIEDEQSSQQK